MTTRLVMFVALAAAIVTSGCAASNSLQLGTAPRSPARTADTIPRTADGKPNLQGIWKVRNRAAADLEDHAARDGMLPGRSVVVGGTIPYQPAAEARRRENFASRATADPLAQCYMPGVPRIMYLDHPFQIFQTSTHIAMAFEWQLSYRLVYLDGTKPPEGLEFWMGDSRGRWDGDTLVVDVTQQNDRTWFDRAGNFHSNEMRVVERYTMRDRNTIEYEATITDPQVFTRPWTIRMPLYREDESSRLLEYHCRAEMEEARGDFTPEARTWYPGPPSDGAAASVQRAPLQPPVTLNPFATARRTARGRPDFSGFWLSDHGGANWGLEPHPQPVNLTPAGRGIIVDPPDRLLPYQPWAREERTSRQRPERGYDDPTAHCFVAAGVPRSFYVPSPFQIIQTDTHVVFLYERMAWRIIPIGDQPFLPDRIRLWQGDSRGRWDGDTLVVETRNFNGRTWLNEVGDVISHAETAVEWFSFSGPDSIRYIATITDPNVYTRSWTIELPINRQRDQLLEVACLEDDQDLQHLKDLKTAPPAQGTQQ